MAVDQLLAPLPKMTLEKLYKVQFEAIDPTTGAAVTGVKVNNVSITTDQAATFEQTTPFDLTPYLLPSAT